MLSNERPRVSLRKKKEKTAITPSKIPQRRKVPQPMLLIMYGVVSENTSCD
jgi:hypothetical protein